METATIPAVKPQSVNSVLSMQPLQLCATAIDKAYMKGEMKVPVLQGVDLCVRKGEFLSIVGQSGSGKSTLLHLLGLLDSPDIGEVCLDGQRIDDLPARTKDQLRNRIFGFIFQSYHLLPELTVLENVLVPAMIRESIWGYLKNRSAYRDRARDILNKVGLNHRLKHRPSELSGGEMQRTAIARALVTNPHVLLADEPTGNLDASTGQEIMDLIGFLNEDQKLTIIMVTHDQMIAKRSSRIVQLKAGRIDTITQNIAAA